MCTVIRTSCTAANLDEIAELTQYVNNIATFKSVLGLTLLCLITIFVDQSAH